MTKRLIYIVAALALLLGIVLPSVAFASPPTVQSTTGKVTVSNVAPTIDSVNVPNPLVPNTTQNITINVTDLNTLNDITLVKIVMAFDAGDTDPDLSGAVTPSVNHLAEFTWDSTTHTFVCVGNGSTAWAGVTGTAPTLTLTNGTFTFSIPISTVAQYGPGGATKDGWDVYFEVQDNGPHTVSTYVRDVAMSTYASLTVSPSPVDFGTLALGDTGKPIATPVDGYFTSTSVVNKGYALEINSGDWTGSSYTASLDEDGNPGANSFSLHADDATPATDAQYVTKTAVSVTTHGADGPTAVETGNPVNISLWIDLGPSMYATTYSGNVTMTVSY